MIMPGKKRIYFFFFNLVFNFALNMIYFIMWQKEKFYTEMFILIFFLLKLMIFKFIKP